MRPWWSTAFARKWTGGYGDILTRLSLFISRRQYETLLISPLADKSTLGTAVHEP